MVGIILIGQSNSGKSVLGKAVADKLGIRYISSGDIARNMADIQDSLNSGEMAPEDRMRREIIQNIALSNVSYILDGFPRFYDQYEWFSQTMTHDLIYIYVDVPEEDIISRAKSRNRSDDGSIYKKMQYFKDNTEPMMREILGDEKVFIINNGNDEDINDNISTLTEIVEEHLNANNSEIR